MFSIVFLSFQLSVALFYSEPTTTRGGYSIRHRRGHEPSRWAPTYDFAIFPLTLHEIEKFLDGGMPPLDSLLTMITNTR